MQPLEFKINIAIRVPLQINAILLLLNGHFQVHIKAESYQNFSYLLANHSRAHLPSLDHPFDHKR